MALITAFYIGTVVDPLAHLHGLPVAVVNQDRGAGTGAQRVDFGQQVQRGLLASPVVSGRLGLEVSGLPTAQQVMDRDGAYAAVVIPPGRDRCRDGRPHGAVAGVAGKDRYGQ